MHIEAFKIDDHFFTHAGEWICTDIGTRTITAVNYDEYIKSGDVYPPFSIVEYSFDAYDMEGCWPKYEDLSDRHDMLNRRDELHKQNPYFFEWLQRYLFEADLLGIAYEGFEDEYALERDHIMSVLDHVSSLESMEHLVKLVFQRSFEEASQKILERDFQLIAQDIWQKYRAI